MSEFIPQVGDTLTLERGEERVIATVRHLDESSFGPYLDVLGFAGYSLWHFTSKGWRVVPSSVVREEEPKEITPSTEIMRRTYIRARHRVTGAGAEFDRWFAVVVQSAKADVIDWFDEAEVFGHETPTEIIVRARERFGVSVQKQENKK